MANFAENKSSLTDVPQGWYVAYAMSTDLNFGAGLPKHMNEVYDLEEKLTGKELTVGSVCATGNVLNLFVKEDAYYGVEIDNLAMALNKMKKCIDCKKIRQLAIPKLCCGKNGLDWESEVKPLIEETLADVDIDVMICRR